MISWRLFKFHTVILFCFTLTGLFKKQRFLTLLSNYKNFPSKAKNINCNNIYDIKYENESRNIATVNDNIAELFTLTLYSSFFNAVEIIKRKNTDTDKQSS